jgi:hypothetical protein
MPIWLLIAAVATIGVTALLIGVLQRVNRAAMERAARGSGATEVSQNPGKEAPGDSREGREG